MVTVCLTDFSSKKLHQYVRSTQTSPFVDFDCRRCEDDLVSSAERLPLHQRYPLRPPPLHPLPHRRCRRLHLHVIVLQYPVQPVRCRPEEGISGTWKGGG